MERTLILIRHGKSDWSTGRPDVKRPLARRGRRQAPETGRWLAAHHPAIDLAVVSPARRARETWELIAEELGPTPVVVDDRVYGGSLADVVASLPEEAGTVALVGHNPALEDLVARLTGGDVAMVTSAIAVIALEDWSGGGMLRAAGRLP